jgi:serine phosphatase RsbU (regulator of sigma subunit)
MQQRAPRRLLSALHDTLVTGEGRGEFCTVCCGLLQRSQQPAPGVRLTLACAGHPPPIIRRADGTVSLATCTGPLLGVPVHKVAFRQQELDLEPGDAVVMYTDGITEAHQLGHDLFGEERLMEVVHRAGPDVDRIADDILGAVTAYGPSDPRDDLAVVVVQIAG